MTHKEWCRSPQEVSDGAEVSVFLQSDELLFSDRFYLLSECILPGIQLQYLQGRVGSDIVVYVCLCDLVGVTL